MTNPDRPLQLLLVDDERSVRTSLTLVFEDDGWSVVAVDSGEAAIETYLPGGFDLVVTDKNMPGMSGIDLVQKIREIDPDVALLMLTGYGSEESAIATLNLGVDAYVEKPIRDAMRLTARARNIIKRKAKASQPQAASSEFRALVVCPDETRQRMILSDLSGTVDHVVSAADAAGAKNQLADKAFQLVLFEQSTPEFLESVEAVKQERPRLPVAVFGQALGLPVVLRLLDAGVSAVIDMPLGTKPCTQRVSALVAHAKTLI